MSGLNFSAGDKSLQEAQTAAAKAAKASNAAPPAVVSPTAPSAASIAADQAAKAKAKADAKTATATLQRAQIDAFTSNFKAQYGREPRPDEIYAGVSGDTVIQAAATGMRIKAPAETTGVSPDQLQPNPASVEKSDGPAAPAQVGSVVNDEMVQKASANANKIQYRDHAGSNAERNEVVMFADMRVFIMGVEVTSWLVEALTVSKGLNGTENQCSFTLDNTNDRFIMRPENFAKLRKKVKDGNGNLVPKPFGKYRYDQSQDPERLPETGLDFSNRRVTEEDLADMVWITDVKNSQNGTFEYDESAKADLYRYKAPLYVSFDQSGAHNTVDSSGKPNTAGASPAATSAPGSTPANKSVAKDPKAVSSYAAPLNTSIVAALIGDDDQRKDYETAQALEKQRGLMSGDISPPAVDANGQLSYANTLGVGPDGTMVKPPVNEKLSGMPWYNLDVGSCVIGLHDEVRVFVADPNHDPVSDSQRRWMPLFTGVVSSAPLRHSRTDGVSALTISCADVRYLLKKMRVTANIQARNQVPTYIRFDDAIGIFQDAAFFVQGKENSFESIASQLSYRHLTRGLLCGDNPADILAMDHDNLASKKTTCNSLNIGNVGTTDDPWYTKLNNRKHNSSTKYIQVSGVGNFSLGWEQQSPDWTQADWKSRVSVMESWQDVVTFGAKLDWYTDAEVTMIGSGTKPQASPEAMSPYSVLNGFVHYLYPRGDYNPSDAGDANKLGIRNLIERAIVNPGSDVSWTNRLEMLTQVSDTIDYKFHVNGMGDFCFEFPMYDFTPNYFGRYAETMSFSDSIKSDEHNDEGDGNVVTALKVTGGYKDIEKSNDAAGSNPVVQEQVYSVWIKSDYMAGKYGIVCEEYQIPWALNVWRMRDGANDTDAMHKNTLISFGIIEFYKRIVAMSSMSADICYNPFACPNRPFLNKLLRRMGVSDSVSITLNIDSTLSTSVTANFIRRAKQSDDEKQRFQTITGYMNTPFGYVADGLKLFTDEALENLRHDFGIEVIDPKTNKYADAVKNHTAGDSFNGRPAGSTGIWPSGARGNGGGYNAPVTYAPKAAKRLAAYKSWKSKNPKVAEAFEAVVRQHCGKLDPAVAYMVMCSESGMNPKISNKITGRDGKVIDPYAQGIFQAIPSTLRGMKDASGNPIDPATFKDKYPTVQSQLPLLGQYLANVQASTGGGALDTTQKLVMAVALPGSMAAGDSITTPFSASASSHVAKLAPDIARLNNGWQNANDILLSKGIIVQEPPATAAFGLTAQQTVSTQPSPQTDTMPKPGLQAPAPQNAGGIPGTPVYGTSPYRTQQNAPATVTPSLTTAAIYGVQVPQPSPTAPVTPDPPILPASSLSPGWSTSASVARPNVVDQQPPMNPGLGTLWNDPNSGLVKLKNAVLYEKIDLDAPRQPSTTEKVQKLFDREIKLPDASTGTYG